jgi:uncharacterized protein YjiS (DUF1127 family)
MHLLTSLPDAAVLNRRARHIAFVSPIGWIMGMRQRRRQRLAVSTLSDHLLRDIGLAHPYARFVSQKQFWRR